MIPKHIKNALNKRKNFKPMNKRIYDITYTNKFGDIDNTTEHAYTLDEARSQAESHLTGTGCRSIDKVELRQ